MSPLQYLRLKLRRRRVSRLIRRGETGRAQAIILTDLAEYEARALRRSRREILRPARLLYSPPLIYGPDPVWMEMWQAARSFQEQKTAKMLEIRRKALRLRDQLDQARAVQRLKPYRRRA